MRRRRPTALLAAGNAAASPLLRNNSVRTSLGPVKCVSLRVASRLVNGLRAGHPVDDFAEIDDCRLILAVGPHARMADLVAELRDAPLKLSNKSLVICGDGRFADLPKLDLHMARIREVPGFEDRWFVVDGDREAATEVRRVLGPSIRFTVLPAENVALWDGALLILEQALLTVTAAADDCLRRVSVPPAHADELVHRALERAARVWTRGKRRIWTGAAEAEEIESRLRA